MGTPNRLYCHGQMIPVDGREVKLQSAASLS